MNSVGKVTNSLGKSCSDPDGRITLSSLCSSRRKYVGVGIASAHEIHIPSNLTSYTPTSQTLFHPLILPHLAQLDIHGAPRPCRERVRPPLYESNFASHLGLFIEPSTCGRGCGASPVHAVGPAARTHVLVRACGARQICGTLSVSGSSNIIY